MDEFRLDVILEGSNKAGPAVREFETDIARLEAELSKLDSKDVEVEATLTSEKMEQEIDQLERRLAQLDKNLVEIEVRAQTERAQRDLSEPERQARGTCWEVEWSFGAKPAARCAGAVKSSS